MEFIRCDYCLKLVKRYNYTNHCRSCPLRQPSTNYEYQTPATPDDGLQPSDGEDNTALRPLLQLSSRTTPVSGHLSQQETVSSQPNDFEMWLENPMYGNAQPYTTIDGQMREPDSSQAQLRQLAEIFRHTTREDVIKIVSEFEGFPSGVAKKTCLELVRKVPILPGLVAFTYTHLVVCPRHGWLHKDDWSRRVDELKRLVERWTKYSELFCILSFKAIKDRLLDILRLTKVRPEEHKCNSALIDGMKLSSHDILNLAALTVLCVTGPQKDDILGQRGTQADEIVELFHSLLETDIDSEFDECRRHLLNPLISLSKISGYCPANIFFEEHAISGLVPQSHGGFGFVYKGNLSSRLVAVKVLKRAGVSLPEYNKQVAKEAIVWRHLRHPNCIPLYGAYRMPLEGPNMCTALVSPWMDHGTLLKYLESNLHASRTQLILDVLRGLNYLHSMQPHVAHRDIKPDNILITRAGRACLADFGLSSTFDTNDHSHTAPSQINMGGTYQYMAPEIWKAEDQEAKRKVNKRACDMYAVGCTVYAAYTGRHPFEGMNPALIPPRVISGKRPDFPEGKITPDMWSFVKNLWGPEPEERLTAEMAIGWMEFKAQQEGVDTSLAPLEEWEWECPRHKDKSLWSVPYS